MNIDDEIYKLIDREGGFIDRPSELGGPVKYGITIETLTNWRGHVATAHDIEALTRKMAYEIYYSRYFLAPGIAELPMLLQPVMLDMSANHGHKSAIKMLQEALTSLGYDCGSIDGRCGEKTATTAMQAWDTLGNQLIKSLTNRRIICYENIVKSDAALRAFLPTWIARAESFLPGSAS